MKIKKIQVGKWGTPKKIIKKICKLKSKNKENKSFIGLATGHPLVALN